MSNQISKNIKNENGQAALLMVLIVMMMLLFIGLFLTNTVSKQTRVARNTEKFTQAYFLADTGTERILYEVIKAKTIDLDNFSVDDELFGGPIGIGSLGDFNAVLIDDSPFLIIKITGTHLNTARAIEISWD